MRSEKEVLHQLLTFAGNNDMVRAVLLNGSRVNPNVENDIFSDYDVIFAVTDPKYFLNNQEWIKFFGDLIIMQQNNLHSNGEEWYIFLMLFSDGIRIDLSFRKVDNIKDYLDDSLTRKLMDKDNRIRDLVPPSDISYYTKKPTKAEFDKTINEFWWVSTNVAKGLWREELPYAKFMFDVVVRDCLIKMLDWYIGMNHNWSINSGKAGRWFEKLLPVEIWESYKKTYAGTNYEEIWASLLEAGKLAGMIGIQIANHLGYNYPIEDSERVLKYLNKVRSLSKNATNI